MGCFAIICGGKTKKKTHEKRNKSSSLNTKEVPKEGRPAIQSFSYMDLVAATMNFRADCILGEGGFGKVYKGLLKKTQQLVAIKRLGPESLQVNKGFLAEIIFLSLHHHPNLVNLIGYCADGNEKLLVYEYMPLGSLEDHLHDTKRLDWNTRMRIAAGAVKGLEYLHNEANPSVTYRDLKCSNILLDELYHPKLSDIGLANLGPEEDKSHVSTRVMGMYVYSFGVVLLEIITGKRANDNSSVAGDNNLVEWVRPLVKDRTNFPQIADPALRGQYPSEGLYQVLAIAAMCVQDEPTMRPLISEVVKSLDYIASHKYY